MKALEIPRVATHRATPITVTRTRKNAIGGVLQLASAVRTSAGTRWHEVFLDNRFVTPNLAIVMSRQKTIITGTHRPNFHVPAETRVLPETRKAAIAKARQTVKLAVADPPRSLRLTSVGFYDQRPVHMLTTGNYSFVQKAGGTKQATRLDIVHSYNKHMNGVDRLDQLVGSYPTYIKSRKWYSVVWHWCLTVAAVNAYTLWKKAHDGTCTHLQFREQLIDGLRTMGAQPGRSKRRRQGSGAAGRPRKKSKHARTAAVSPSHKKTGFHDPIKVTRGRCRQCYLDGRRSECNVGCSNCEVPLHVGECWAKFHGRPDFEK